MIPPLLFRLTGYMNQLMHSFLQFCWYWMLVLFFCRWRCCFKHTDLPRIIAMGLDEPMVYLRDGHIDAERWGYAHSYGPAIHCNKGFIEVILYAQIYYDMYSISSCNDANRYNQALPAPRLSKDSVRMNLPMICSKKDFFIHFWSSALDTSYCTGTELFDLTVVHRITNHLSSRGWLVEITDIIDHIPDDNRALLAPTRVCNRVSYSPYCALPMARLDGEKFCCTGENFFWRKHRSV